MEVRLPLVWKSHPILIDPHPPPSLHSRLSPRASPPSPLPQHPFVFSLNCRHCFHLSISLSPRQLYLRRPSSSPSLSSNIHPLSFRPRSSPSLRSLPFSSSPPPCQPREEIHFREKKREKGTKNRCATPIGRTRPGSRLHSFAACSWAWLKDELSLCHRLY